MICCSACNMVSPGFNSGAFIAVFSLKLLLQLMDFMEFQTFSSKRVSFSTHCCIYIYILYWHVVFFLIRIILLPLHIHTNGHRQSSCWIHYRRGGFHCGVAGAVFACGRCHAVHFCGPSCQKGGSHAGWLETGRGRFQGVLRNYLTVNIHKVR